jgi:STAND-like protein
MSSSGQATSSSSNVQSIIEVALADYTKITGTDLSKTPFAAALERSNSPDAILQLLNEREKSFEEYRDGNRRLINCLTPAVTILQAFSGILGAVSQVSHTCHSVTPTLLTVTPSDPLSTSKRIVCWYRYSPCCTSLPHVFNGLPVMNEYTRLPVGLHPVTMLFSSCSSVWGSSLSVSRSIREFRPLRY